MVEILGPFALHQNDSFILTISKWKCVRFCDIFSFIPILFSFASDR